MSVYDAPNTNLGNDKHTRTAMLTLAASHEHCFAVATYWRSERATAKLLGGESLGDSG